MARGEPVGANGITVRLAQARPIPLDVSFDCPAGQLTALVGPSGGGKSTILRSIAGIYAPLSGTVRCNGDVWYDTAQGINISPQHRATGYVFQDYALFP
ncbi:MAG: ATP-binding cassette domain-containing protein, partial [Fimbriimonadaceae bacterium]|nr:ATP-binding cassette domain-containing protein [Alphaproteobacteria bacterium]